MRALARHGPEWACRHAAIVTGRFKGDVVGLLGNSLELKSKGTMSFDLIFSCQRELTLLIGAVDIAPGTARRSFDCDGSGDGDLGDGIDCWTSLPIVFPAPIFSFCDPSSMSTSIYSTYG